MTQGNEATLAHAATQASPVRLFFDLFKLRIGLVIGFPLVIAGCWLAATGGTLRTKPPSEDLPPVASG